MKLLIPLTQTCGEDVVLPAIQLFRLTLITGMLLLITLTRLLIKTTLIALALETGIRTATTITQTMRART